MRPAPSSTAAGGRGWKLSWSSGRGFPIREGRREPEVSRDLQATDEARIAMAGFLLGSGDLRAVRAVARNLLGQSEPVRSAVLESIENLGELLGRADPSSKPAIEREIE